MTNYDRLCAHPNVRRVDWKESDNELVVEFTTGETSFYYDDGDRESACAWALEELNGPDA